MIAFLMACPFHQLQLTVLHVRDGAVLVDVDVEAIGLKVLGHHHAGLDDAVLLGQVFLAEALRGSAGK